MNHVRVTFENGESITCKPGTAVGELTQCPASIEGLPPIAARINNDVSSLSYPLTVNSRVEFLTMADPNGWRVYRRSLCFLLAKAVRDLYPDSRTSVEHSFGPGLYCTFRQTPDGPEGIEKEQVKRLQARMLEIVAEDIPILRHKISYEDAVNCFREAGLEEKLPLLAHRNPPRIVLHRCDGFWDLAHGPLVPRTGSVTCFQLIPYEPGFVLHVPDRATPCELQPFEDQPHLFKIFQEHKEWGRILGVNTIGRLNETIAEGQIGHFIRTTEALHEKKLARIADEISGQAGRIKLVLIAGPSSAGKTTFAKRLSVQLMVNGLRPVTVSTDDYFVGADRNPVDEDGEPDYEHLEAVDLDLFNSDLLKLIDGEAVRVPRFNFETKAREYHDEDLQIRDDQILLIEGIHGLNPRLTQLVPNDRKYRVYVSALTQLSVDSNNRISTTDNRLMRRIIRDSKFRGYPPLETLQRWPSVRRGEKRWIFPFQREANATFNSALDYELAILKPLIEPLLMQVKPYDREYAEARRLTEFLLNFVPASAQYVPHNSILREYIGDSDFRY